MKQQSLNIKEYSSYENCNKDEIINILKGYLSRYNNLSFEYGIEDHFYLNEINNIFIILFERYGFSGEQARMQKNISHLFERYDELNIAWDKADNNGGRGIEKIEYEMSHIQKKLNSFGLNTEGGLLKSKGNPIKSPEIAKKIGGEVLKILD